MVLARPPKPRKPLLPLILAVACFAAAYAMAEPAAGADAGAAPPSDAPACPVLGSR